MKQVTQAEFDSNIDHGYAEMRQGVPYMLYLQDSVGTVWGPVKIGPRAIPATFEVDSVNGDATGVVHPYCSVECRDADLAQLEAHPGSDGIRYVPTLNGGEGCGPGAICENCLKPLDATDEPPTAGDIRSTAVEVVDYLRGHTVEFSNQPNVHNLEYDWVEERLLALYQRAAS